jgi:hypothetical protein
VNAEDLLTETLREQTDRTEYPSTPMATVVTRAHGVRRRRARTATLAAAAAVAAIAVPGGVWLSRSPDSAPGPSHQLSSGPTNAPSPSPVRGLADLPSGPKPGVDYLVGDTYVTMTGERFTAGVFANASTATPARGGILVTVPRAPGLMQQAGIAETYLESNGHSQYLGCGSDRFAMSTDGVQSAYWLSDACPVTGSSTGKLFSGVNNTMGESGTGYAVTAAGATVEPVGILPQGTVVDTPRAQIVDSSGHTSDVAALATAGGSDENNDVISGQLRTDDSTGAVVDASSGSVLWRAPGWELGQFSNDGKYVLGAQPRNGPVPDGRAVFDAATGEKLVELPGPGADITLGQVAWGVDHTVLAIASEGHASAIVRFGLDGRLTRATPVVDVSDQHLGYRLAVRP